ncbi:MAG: flagellar motor switch protein FliN [Rhodospirillaceae bacterium]
MADNDETDIPEDESGAPDDSGQSDGGAAMDLSDLGTQRRGTVDDGAELLQQEEPPEPIRTAKDLDAVYDIPVQLSAVLGRANMQVSQLLKLGRGAVVELDRKVGEAIDIYVNNRLVARGEVVVVEERLGITMTEIIKSDRIG